MTGKSHAVDRRAALKARSRQAILDAAAALMRQRRSADFSVEDLAAAADVSRRTVFNHFGSLEDVVIAVAGEMLGELVDHMEARATSESGEARTMLEDLAATASSAHLVPTVVYLAEIFGGEEHLQSNRGALLMNRALSLFTPQMSVAIANRHPEADRLKVELLVAAFSGGLLAIADRWILATGAVDTPDSRRTWDQHVSCLTAVLREPVD